MIFRQMPKTLSIYEKMLMLALSNRWRGVDTQIEISVEVLILECSMSKRSVMTHLKSLESRGFITRTRRGLGQPNTYQIDLAAMGVNTNDFRNQPTSGFKLQAVS